MVLTDIENVYRAKERELEYVCVANEYVAEDLPLRLHIQIILKRKYNTSKKGIKEILRMYHFYCLFKNNFILLYYFLSIFDKIACGFHYGVTRSDRHWNEYLKKGERKKNFSKRFELRRQMFM